MAQRPYWTVESLGESSTTSTSYVNKLTTSFTPNASKAVAVFFFCEVGQSNTSSGAYARLTIGGVEKCFGSFVTKEVSSPRDYNPVSGFAIIPASGSPSSQTINIDYCPESGVTGYIRNARIVAIELGANDYYDEEATRQTRTGSTTLANVSGLSIAPASGDYIVFGSAQSDMNSNTDGAQLALTASASPTSEPYVSSVRDNVGIGTTYPIQRLQMWDRTSTGSGSMNGTDTISLGFAPNTSGNTMGIQNARVLALNIADFDNVYRTTLGSDSTGTQTTYQDALSLNAATPAANPHFSVAAWSHEGSSTTVSTYTRFNDDGDALNEWIREAYVTTNDRGDSTGGSGRIETWTTSSRDLKLQRRSETSSSTARLKRGAMIAAFDLGSAGGGGYTLTADAATFTETGVAATLRAARKLAAAQAAYALTPGATGLRKGYPLAAQSATYAVTANATALRAARRLAAAQATYTVTASASGLRRGYTLTAGAQTFTLTAFDVGLKAARKLSATQATFVETGNAAGLRAARKLAAVSATYTLTGYDANLVYTAPQSYTLTADAASYSLTGQPAVFRAARRMTAQATTYTFTANATGLKATRKLASDPASFVLTANDAALIYTPRVHYTLTVESAAFLLTAWPAGLVVARAPDAIGYPISGLTVIASRNAGLTVSALPTAARTITARANGGLSITARPIQGRTI